MFTPAATRGSATASFRQGDLIQRQRRPMPGRLQPQLNQFHYLNRLACRDRINADPVKRIANGGLIGRIVAR